MESLNTQQHHDRIPVHQHLRTKLLTELTYGAQELLQDMLLHLDRPTPHLEHLSTLYRAMQLLDSGLTSHTRVPLRLPLPVPASTEKTHAEE